MKPTGKITLEGIEYPIYSFRIPNCARKVVLASTELSNALMYCDDYDEIRCVASGISEFIPRKDLDNLTQEEITDKYLKHSDAVYIKVRGQRYLVSY